MCASTEAPLKASCNSLASKLPSLGQSHKICIGRCWNVLLPHLTWRVPEHWDDRGTVFLLPFQSLTKLGLIAHLLPYTSWQGPTRRLLKVRLLGKDWIPDILTYEAGSRATTRILQKRFLVLRKTPCDNKLGHTWTKQETEHFIKGVQGDSFCKTHEKRKKKRNFSFHSIWSFNRLQKYWPTVVIKSPIYAVLKQGQSLTTQSTSFTCS